MTTRVSGDYVETVSPQGYVNNREITNLPGHFLVKGSKNVRIINKEKVASSKRYKIKGAAKTVNNPIVTSFDWKTNTRVYRNIRGYRSTRGVLQVWYENAWETIKTGFRKINFEWTTYWDTTELLDVLIGVCGDDKLYMWSGGIAEVASVTATTITKKGYVSGTTYAIDASNSTITDSGSGFVTAGFQAGDSITISGTTYNDGEYTIDTVTADTITIVDSEYFDQSEVAGASLIIKWTQEGTWAESRFFVSLSGRKVRIGSYTYAYSSGEDTGTLTLTSGNPVTNGVVAGDLAMQEIVESEPAALNGRTNDIVGVTNNHLFVASYNSRTVYISANDDYTDFAYTTPLRVPGEGFILTLDSTPTAIVPDEDQTYISAGDNDWYRVYTEFTDDLGGEAVIVRKLKTANGQSVRNPGAVAYIKNNIALLTFEKVVDTLGHIENVETTQTRPISDDIKDDLDSYDTTNAHALYYKRSLYIALPVEGLLLEYDLRFGYWQPPQLLPIQRLAIIDERLCGHSSSSNETYTLFEGYNDNGAPFQAVAAFGYENFGSRFGLKNHNEIATELYISRNTQVTNTVLYGFKGAIAVKSFVIDGSDETITETPADSGSLGSDKLGNNPLGGVLAEPDDLVKARAIDTTSFTNFFERQRVFSSSSPDCRFEIIAYGENTQIADSEPNFIKR